MRTREPRHARCLPQRRFAALAAALLVCLCAGGADAQTGKGEYLGRWSVAAAAGYAIPNTDEYANGLGWRVALGYSPLPGVELSLEGGSFAAAVEQPERDGIPAHDIASGRFATVPLVVSARFALPLAASRASVFLLAGGGYALVDYEMGAAQRAVFAAGGGDLPDQRVSDTWELHAGCGLEYALAASLSLTLEGRYQLLAPPVRGTAADGYAIAGSLDLNTWLFTGGMKVAF